MAASYPNEVKQWTDKQDLVDDVFAGDINGAYDEIKAIEQDLLTRKPNKGERFIIGTSIAGWTAKDCDYLCDGTADDVEINAAITALPSSGGEIIILDGTYNITAKINVNKSNVTLRGNGNATVFKRMFESETKNGLVEIYTPCKIEYIKIEGNKNTYSETTNIGIYIYNGNDVRINYCSIERCSGESIYTDMLSYNINITGNTCYYNKTGIYIKDSDTVTATNNNCWNNDVGICLESSNKSNITNNSCIREEGRTSNYTSSQYTILLSGTNNSSNLVTNNNCMGKAPVVEGGTGNSVHNNKWNETDDFTDLKTDVETHKADDVTLGEIPHIGLGGSISHATDTGTTGTPHKRQVNVSSISRASGNLSQVNASTECEATGQSSQVNVSRLCEASNTRTSIIASQRVKNDISESIAGGFNDTGNASTANRKWHIFSRTGDIQHAGTISSGHSFTDYAELFPNLTGEPQGAGLLQTIDGYGVRPANENEDIIGVTSAMAGVILGDTPFSWQGRWLKDEWGEYIYETVIDDETGEEVIQPKENPNWNPELKQQSRLERPNEWTVVGLVGQVYVRLKEDVEVMDYVKAWQGGIGQTSQEPTNIQVMKITQEYDEEKGYKIGFCLLK